MIWLVNLLIILACGMCNKMRGGGFGAHRWLGHPRWYIALVMGALAYCAGASLVIAPVFALCWLAWATPAWGRWFTCGRQPREISGAPAQWEAWIEGLAWKITWRRRIADHLCLAIRNAVCLAPVLFIAPLAWPIMLIGMAASYEIAWRIWPNNEGNRAIDVAEIATGLFWGVALVLSF